MIRVSDAAREQLSLTKDHGPAGSGRHSIALHCIRHGVCSAQASTSETAFSQNIDLGMHGTHPPLTAFSRPVSRSFCLQGW